MTRRKKIVIGVAAGVPALLLVLFASLILVMRTQWFANFAKEKLISTVEDATGGTVEVGSFQFDWSHLTIRIRNFVLHGTEPKSADPLARAGLLEVRLKLFSGIAHTIDLAYVGAIQPRVNLIVNPDGTTNIPQPKTVKQPSQTSGLETVVDLKIGAFQIANGVIEYSQTKSAFSGRGENLRVLLNYDFANPSYAGNLSIDPLLITLGTNRPLAVHVNLPVTIQKDAVQLTSAKLSTTQSQVLLNASVRDMKAPKISAQLNANVSLPEMQSRFDLPINSSARGVPQTLTAELTAQMDQDSKSISVQSAHIAVGQTMLQASGTAAPGSNSAIRFNASFALGQLAELLNVTSVRAAGELQANGTAKLDARNNYALDGTINSRGVAVRSSTTDISNFSLFSPFHVDPYLVTLDGLRVQAFGGVLAAKVFVEKFQQMSVEGSLRNFSIPVLARSATGKTLAYDGTLNGSLTGKGDLKAKGTTAFVADANLTISPGQKEVPIGGRVLARYNGAADSVDVGKSYIALPHSRLDISGAVNRRIDLNLVSHNLNDFLPAANFASGKASDSLPASLESAGSASIQAQIAGNLSTPQITGHLGLSNFAIEQRRFDQLTADLMVSSSGATVQNGTLARNILRASFDASIGLRRWRIQPSSQLAANVTLRNGDIPDLLSIAGEGSVPATGSLSADVHINGTYGNPLGSANVQVVNGSAYNQPIDRLVAQLGLQDQLIALSNVELAAAGGRIDLNGTYQHPRDTLMTGHAQLHLATTNVQLSNIRPLEQASPGIAGAIQLTADAAADISKAGEQTVVNLANIAADLSARGLRVQNQPAGDLTGNARTSNGSVNYRAVSNFAGSDIRVTGQTALSKDYRTTADAAIQNLSVEKALSIAGQGGIPARGTLSANAHVSGTMESPNADLSFDLAQANVYQEPINRLQGRVQYAPTAVSIPSLRLDVPAGNVTLTGSFNHPVNNLKTGSVLLNVTSSDIQLSKVVHVQQAKSGLAGTLRLALDSAATMRDTKGAPPLLFSRLNANLAATDLRVGSRPLGEATADAKTTGSNLAFRLDSDIAQTAVHAAGQTQLTGDYVTRANLRFANVRYSNLAPFITTESTAQRGFDALVEGDATVNGPLLKTDDLTGRLQLTRLQAQTLPQGSPTGAPARRTVAVQNSGPIVIALDRSVLHIQHLQIGGPGTNINASGSISLKDSDSPLSVTTAATLDLGVLQDVDREFYSSGAVAMNATVHGSFTQPLVNGRVELKNANVNYAGAPNGLSNGNGVILLSGTSATIQTLTGESGGGKISVAGFVGYASANMNVNLRATATRVRVRYSGFSVTSSANVTVTGSTRRSLASGTVTVQRIAYGSTGDVGSILSTTSTPPSVPQAPSPLLAGMRLDVRIQTAPDLRVITTYANRLNVYADLSLRGTAATPGMLGRVTVTDGQLVFFGNTYTVNTGTINFYTPNAIQPVLNISLETIAQNVDVVIGVTGPIDNLNLSYRSDPPLRFEQIVQLLATNTTPSDPTIAAQQPASPTQSFTQMGESALLGQAIANPLASRVQRVFGITEFKIDPSIQGTGGQPSARVSLTQKIASNITFTYITDVTQTNAQIVRVEWAFTPRLSFVGLREFNGNVSLEVFYKFKRR